MRHSKCYKNKTKEGHLHKIAAVNFTFDELLDAECNSSINTRFPHLTLPWVRAVSSIIFALQSQRHYVCTAITETPY